MTRQEAIAELKRMAATIEWDYPLDAQIAIEKAVEALSGPTPDPITGLVDCGCGGKADCNDLGIVTKEGERAGRPSTAPIYTAAQKARQKRARSKGGAI